MFDEELTIEEEERLLDLFVEELKKRGLSDKWQYDDTSQSLSRQIRKSGEGRQFRGAMIVRKKDGTEKRYPWEASGFY